jgi:hypothetical protein
MRVTKRRNTLSTAASALLAVLGPSLGSGRAKRRLAAQMRRAGLDSPRRPLRWATDAVLIYLRTTSRSTESRRGARGATCSTPARSIALVLGA